MIQKECPFESWQLIQARKILQWLTEGKEMFEKDKGKDSFAFISIIPTEVKDTIYYFYAVKVHNNLWSSTDICIFDKPVYISKFYVDK